MGINIECLRNLFRRPFTERYPFEKIEPYERYRGKLVYMSEKCIGCKLCVNNCPSDCITFHEKGRIDFDLGACLFCGLCADLCPTEAIVFNNEFEYASTKKKDFIVK